METLLNAANSKTSPRSWPKTSFARCNSKEEVTTNAIAGLQTSPTLFAALDDAYASFKEADIAFPPTYKYDLRSDDAYAKHRVPAYTVSQLPSQLNITIDSYWSFQDRILYRDKSTSPIECTQYKSIERVKHSDHKPVVAHFRMKLKPGLHM